MSRWWALWALWSYLLALPAAAVSAEPMRLENPTPRWVWVEFEDSPTDRPDLLDAVYTERIPAWLETDSEGRLTVRVAGAVLEERVFRENDPVPGSFSDFVWVFDGESGEVLSAEFSGAFSFRIDWGFGHSEIRAEVRARMGTTSPAGFRPARRILGQALHGFCRNVESRRCNAVPPRPYDPARGYVNAVGYLEIDSPVKRFETFSAVGEARFSERSEAAPVGDPVSHAHRVDPGG